MKVKELLPEQLTYHVKEKNLTFKSTKEVEPSRDIIGIGKTSKDFKFGLDIKSRGYNIYLAGSTGTGKTTYAKEYLAKFAKKKKIPDDWCYVYNFENTNEPVAISLPAGMGKEFQADMEEFVDIITIEIPKAFENNDYEKQKNDILQSFQEKKTSLIEELNSVAEKQGFKVKTTPNGIYFLPIVKGKALSEEEFNELEDTERNKIMSKSGKIQLKTMDVVRKIKLLEKEAESMVEECENNTALFAVGVHINELMEKYHEYPKIISYLYSLQNDVLKNIEKFAEEDVPEEAQMFLPGMFKKDSENPVRRYKVNLFIDNSKAKGAPVIVDYNPTFYNLVGKLEYENEMGAVTTDYTMIKPGLLHQANGGYIVLQVKDVLMNPLAWEALKRCIKTQEIQIENMKDQINIIAVSGLKPEPIPLDVKVILAGGEDIYHILLDADDDFSKLFKIKVEFEDEIDATDANIKKFISFVSAFSKNDKTLDFDKEAVKVVLEYASKVAGDQRKITTRFNDILAILAESCAWATFNKSSVVKAEHVKKAMTEKKSRSNSYDKRMQECILDNTIMIETEGAKVGEINGLSVIDMGDCIFGKPSKITANTFIGKSGIVNIEREAEMSGTSHTKGVMILSAYIGEKYAQDLPLALTASLCFEQLYSGVDGDSASSTEIYAILSSLSGIPIKQGIAVTGSVNQKGEIQPIGGATDKIEGFFQVCKARKLDGTQGVVIPHQNVKNLHLCEEVVEAVREGKFHIWPVKTIDEGIEILTGVPAGTRGKDGKYKKDTINYEVYEKLRGYAETVVNFGKKDDIRKY